MLNLLDSLWLFSIFTDLSPSLPHLQNLRMFFLCLLSFLHLRSWLLIEPDVPLEKVEDELLLLPRFLLFTFGTFITPFLLVVFSWCISSLCLITVVGFSIISNNSYSGICNNHSTRLYVFEVFSNHDSFISFSSKLNFVNENQMLYNVFDMLKCQRETDLPFQCQI